MSAYAWLLWLLNRVQSSIPGIILKALVSHDVGFAGDRGWFPAMMPQGWGGSGHTLPVAISVPSSTPALP